VKKHGNPALVDSEQAFDFVVARAASWSLARPSARATKPVGGDRLHAPASASHWHCLLHQASIAVSDLNL